MIEFNTLVMLINPQEYLLRAFGENWETEVKYKECYKKLGLF
jgi:hypothetical protein